MKRPATNPLDLERFEIRRQPDESTCGPTCLHAIYRYFGDDVSLESLLAEIDTVEGGGTLGVTLANHALSRGYRSTMVTWNLRVFDPTWFELDRDALRDKVEQRMRARSDRKLKAACRAYVTYLERGGVLELSDLEPSLLRRPLRRGLPILTGLSASFLYREARESEAGVPDDVKGDAVGHFVVLTGYRPAGREVLVSDPLPPDHAEGMHTYPVKMERLIGAVYLGVLTYDANLIVLEPPTRAAKHR